eukprot:4612306-Pleurochrysis_carterae.AAC.1
MLARRCLCVAHTRRALNSSDKACLAREMSAQQPSHQNAARCDAWQCRRHPAFDEAAAHTESSASEWQAR